MLKIIFNKIYKRQNYFSHLNQNDNNAEKINIYQLSDILNLTIKNETILIFEANNYHSECFPGFSKYFTDLGYDVDIIMHNSGKTSFDLFEFKEKIRLIIYNDINYFNFFADNLISYMNNYSFILIQTTTPYVIKIISKLNLLSNSKVIYVFHFTEFYEQLNFSKIQNQYRIWTLGHFPIGLQVNPHYVGKIKLRNKNKKTRFFIVSTEHRNYNYLISASNKLKDENLDFDIIVTGNVKGFSTKNINEKIKNNFIFNYNIKIKQLYKAVDSSDFIIITLDPNIENNKNYKYKKVTGSAQLSYGFIKPTLIDKYFSSAYNMTENTSFLFDKDNFYQVMREAILLNNENYKKMQKNLIKLRNKLYLISFLNVKRTLKSLEHKI